MVLKAPLIAAATAFFLTSPTHAAPCPKPTYIGKFKHKEAAFLDTAPNTEHGVDLLITSFSGMPFSKGSISIVANIQNFLTPQRLQTITPTVLDGNKKWPNGVKVIPSSVYLAGMSSENRRLVSAGGFLVPSHGNGAVTIYELDSKGELLTSFDIAFAGVGKFFHQATWYDVDNDGYDDLISAKASKPMFNLGKPTGALYWYRNPGPTKTPTRKWDQHLMFQGPDVHFELEDLNGDGIPEIIATEFFYQKLTVTWLKEGASMTDGPDGFETRVAKTDLGFLFNMTLVDMQGNGRKDIVLTNHETDPLKAGVYAVEIPVDFKTGEYVTHTLANNFPTLNEGPGQASPGGAVPIPMKKGKDMWAISGDGNQKAYIMCNRGGAYTWTTEPFLDTGNTVGAIAVSDVNGDGHSELFVPSYEKGEIYVYTMKQ